MIQSFSAYIKGIAAFLIFMSFASLIAPSGKFKEYVSLAMNLVLVIIIIMPLGGLLSGFTGNSELLFPSISAQYSREIIEKEAAYYDEAQKKTALSAYATELGKHLKIIAEAESDFTYIDGQFTLDSNTDTLGQIKEIHLTVEETVGKTISSFIRIEPVKPVSPFSENQDAHAKAEQENPKISVLKKNISDFYNVHPDNIHVNVRMKKQ